MTSADAVAAEIARATQRERMLLEAFRGGSVQQAGDQLHALLDLARTLSEAGIRYALIGGIAVGIHSGVPRATMDIDVAVESSVDREGLTGVMIAARFEPRGVFPHSLNFRHASGEPVQIAIDPEFDAIVSRAETIEIAGAHISIVGKQDLITMKERAAGDPARRRSKALRDAADVELLRGDVAQPDEGW